ncbi:MAG: lysophospholipid acyltransferase family protein [Planctomycetes bacterium]|nr:lysophospholipid acyltransferase family protein [Planctomycetota bacterium]
MKIRKPWQFALIGRLGAMVIRLLGATWRGRTRRVTIEQPGFYVMLHANILMFAWGFRDRDVAALVSSHRDGEAIARVMQRLGFHTVRGSSTRGGARAALELLRTCRGRRTIVTPDGPRGPRGKVEDGLIQLASLSGLPLWPVSFAAARAKYLRTWDRFAIPLPFSRVHAVLGEPIHVPRGIDKQRCAELAQELSQRLLDGERDAASVFAAAPISAAEQERGA